MKKSALAFMAALLLGNGATGAWSQTARGPELSLEVVRTLTTKGAVTGVTWSPDGRMLAAISDFGQTIALWRADGTPVRKFERKGHYVRNSISFVSDGHQLLTPADSEAGPEFAFTLWNIETGAIDRNIAGPKLSDVSRRNTAEIFAYSPDGHVVAAANLAPVPIALYESRSWNLVGSFPLQRAFDRPSSIALSANGDCLAAGTFLGDVMTVDTSTTPASSGTLTVYPPPLLIAVSAVAVSPDGKFIATGADSAVGAPQEGSAPDERHVPVKVWARRDRRLAVSYVSADIIAPINQLAWSPDGRFLAAAANDNSVRFYAPALNAQEIGIFRSKLRGVLSAGFSPDGQLFAAADGNTVSILKYRLNS